TGQPAATERLHIMQGIEPGAGYGIILFMSVYSREVREIKPEERRANFRGCVAVLVNLKEVVEGSIRTLDREGLGLKIIDLMAQPSKRLLLQLEPNLAPPENPYSRSEQHGIALQRELPFQIGGRDWNVQFSLDTAYFLKHRPWQAWGVLAGGLLFTGFLGAFLLVVTGRSAAVEELVNQRTGELQLLNRTLAFQMAEREQAETLLIEKTLAMENAFEGIARLDSEGRFTSINRAYANMTGYEAGELIGESWSLVFHADDLARIRRTFEGTQVKKRVDVEARGLRKDGSEFFAEIVRIPAYGADHAFLGHYLFIRDVTARKQAEAELRSSEERFAKVFRSSPVAIAISTVEDGCLIDLNEAYRKMFGYERAEMVGRNAAELIWVDPKRRGDFVRLLRAHHFVHNFEAQFRTKSGEVREGMGSAELIQLDGKPRILSLIHDVTDRKRAEEKLRQSEMQLATAQQIAHLGSWEWQVELNQVTWSDELYRLFGLRPQECQVQYETFLALVHPDDRAFVGKVVSDALKNHEPFEYVFRGLHREKGEVILHATGQVITDADGRAVRMFGTAQDITKQREAEAALRLSEEQFRSAFDHAAIGMALVSLEGRWLRVNASLCRILGYTEQELLAKNFPEMTHPEDLAENMESARRLVAGEISSYQTEKRYFHKQGHIVWVLLSASIVRNFNQAPLHFVSQVEDITARKRAEQELMASLREKEVLLKEVHHRVKNNLQIITSMLNLQAGKVRDTDSLALLKEIQARIRSIALIHETLYRSQDMAHIDFPNYVQTLGANLVRSFASRSQLIRLNIEVDPVQLNVDLAMPCGLIINELVANALKYAFPDKVAGEICIRFQRRSEGEYLLRVTDTGRGFPAGVDFRHTDSLGLQLVCALTAQLGGTITMRSTPGTEFSIIFHE
ncbi:MAG: PAS domain S-box protein, partial [Verrucomicrobiota bacterium]